MYKQIYVTLMKDSRSIMKNLQTKTTKSTKIQTEVLIAND